MNKHIKLLITTTTVLSLLTASILTGQQLQVHAQASTFDIYPCIAQVERNFASRYLGSFKQYSVDLTSGLHAYFAVANAKSRLLSTEAEATTFLVAEKKKYEDGNTAAKATFMETIQTAVSGIQAEVEDCKKGTMPSVVAKPTITIPRFTLDTSVPSTPASSLPQQCQYKAYTTFGHNLTESYQVFLEGYLQAEEDYYYKARPSSWSITDKTERDNQVAAAKSSHDLAIDSLTGEVNAKVKAIVDTITASFTACNELSSEVPGNGTGGGTNACQGGLTVGQSSTTVDANGCRSTCICEKNLELLCSSGACIPNEGTPTNTAIRIKVNAVNTTVSVGDVLQVITTADITGTELPTFTGADNFSVRQLQEAHAYNSVTNTTSQDAVWEFIALKAGASAIRYQINDQIRSETILLTVK